MSYTGVAALAVPAVGEQVVVLVKGNDLLVLGCVGTDLLHIVGGAGEVAFENGWQNYSGAGITPEGWTPAQFWKDGFGVVHLAGVVNRGASALTLSTTIFTLPVGYRPAQDDVFAIDTSGAHGHLRVHANGALQLGAGTVGRF